MQLIPRHKNLFIATAGSLHGFKFLPIIGGYIADMVEGRLDGEYRELWAWRFGENPPPSNIERHPYPARDLAQLDGWRGVDCTPLCDVTKVSSRINHSS
jgi:sarcosine oxidase/L-pipecolate oxidase